MKRSRFDEEQIIRILKEQEAGLETADVCRKHGIGSAIFYKWNAKYGGLEVSDGRELKALMARDDASGDLYLYPGTAGHADATEARVRIGTDWQGVTFAGIADWDGRW